MSDATPGFDSLLAAFYASICKVSRLQSPFRNDLFGALARESRPRTIAGIPATSFGEWVTRFSHNTWNRVREVAGIRRCVFRDGGLTRKERKLVNKVKEPILQALAQIEFPANTVLENVEAEVEGEFRRVLAHWREKKRPEAEGNGDIPLVLQVAYDVVDLFKSTIALLDLARASQLPAQQQSGETDVIFYLGDSKYRIGNTIPIVVSDGENNVLLAFLDNESMDSGNLVEVTGLDRAPRVLRDLRKKYECRFAPAIRTPGRKGRGGYHVAIRDGKNT